MTLVIAIGSRAERVVRGSLGTFKACERLRARRKPGNVLATKDGDDRQNDHDLDERENLLNVFTARHSERRTTHA